MNKTLENVQEFHETFGAPVLNEATIPSKDRIKLRLSLILEELSELAEASNANDSFIALMENKITEMKTKEMQKADIVECVDALADLQVVLSGSILEYGLQNTFDDAFDTVHRSNMSKACLNEDDASKSVAIYHDKGINAHFEKVGKKYVIYRSADHKILKGINFFTPDLKAFV